MSVKIKQNKIIKVRPYKRKYMLTLTYTLLVQLQPFFFFKMLHNNHEHTEQKPNTFEDFKDRNIAASIGVRDY